PSHVATEAIPAARSAVTSCTAPNACDAMPHRKNATSDATAVRSGSAPTSASPNTAGPTKCVLDVAESRTGRSLSRSPGAEYASTARTTTASTTVDATDPTATR